jgi:hypothetical protein
VRLFHGQGNALEAVVGVVRQLKQMLSERGGMLAAFLLLMPMGTGAAAGVLTQAAVAARWGADANAVALTQGVLSGVVTAVGCFIGGWWCERVHPRITYAVIGLLLGGVDLAMVAAPATVDMYVGISMVYSLGVGVAYAAYAALVLDAIGAGAAATKFSVMASLANFPIWWVGLLLGWMADRYGAPAMLETEAALSLLGAGVFWWVLTKARPAPRQANA